PDRGRSPDPTGDRWRTDRARLARSQSPPSRASSEQQRVAGPGREAGGGRTTPGSRPRTRSGGAGVLVLGLEVGLTGAADGAEPGVGDVLERGSGRNASVGISLVGVIDEPARRADPELLGLDLGWHDWQRTPASSVHAG